MLWVTASGQPRKGTGYGDRSRIKSWPDLLAHVRRGQHSPYAKLVLNGVKSPAQELLTVLTPRWPGFAQQRACTWSTQRPSFSWSSPSLPCEGAWNGSFLWISVEQKKYLPAPSMNCIPSRRRPTRNRWIRLTVWIFSNLNMLLTARVLSFRESSGILCRGKWRLPHYTGHPPLIPLAAKRSSEHTHISVGV